MDLNITAARNLLEEGGSELQEVLAGASDEVRAALTSSRERLQIVDEDQKFTSQLPPYMKQWGLYDAGFNYNIIAVFGSQSTGKSTLLNRLFGTTFDVMNEKERRQTTKGIWMCKGQDMNVMVMDVEGTDGRERGEDQDFERKSALFSMATAEVILVNLWEHQVGLYQGANMGLLKTVMEVNLSLFQANRSKQSKDKTLLLFVIRDHIGATPLENLSNTLSADINRLWDGLAKPPGSEDAKLSDYFDMSFATLPHKLLQPTEFDDQVVAMRSRFTDKSDTNFVFKPQYHKRIPADGVAPYMEGIWQQVIDNKDLDLPTQQELLAQFRCDEIANVAFELFESQTKSYRKPVEAGKVIDDLGPSMQKARDGALEQFDTAASRYHSGVYQKKRAELLGQLNNSLSTLFLGQLQNLHKEIVKTFKSTLLEGLQGEGYDFAKVVENCKSQARDSFTKQAGLILLKETDWSVEEPMAQLVEEVDTLADACRVEETKKMVASIEKNIKQQFSEPVEHALNTPSKDMWDKVLTAFRASLHKAESQYKRKAASFNCTDAETEAALISLRQRAWLALRSKIDEQTADSVMLVKLKLAFEDRFRYGPDGVPRIWRPEDDIDALFKTAKDETLALIPLYARIKPQDDTQAFSLPSAAESSDLSEPEFDFSSTLQVLTESKQSDLSARFRREADAYYVEAKRSMVSSISQIPVWMYGVVAFLGWNEFIAVLRSPVYFTMLLILIASAYACVQLNMVGPVTQVGRAIIREITSAANDKLKEHFSQQQLEAAHLARPASKKEVNEKEDIELKKME